VILFLFYFYVFIYLFFIYFIFIWLFYLLLFIYLFAILFIYLFNIILYFFGLFLGTSGRASKKPKTGNSKVDSAVAETMYNELIERFNAQDVELSQLREKLNNLPPASANNGSHHDTNNSNNSNNNSNNNNSNNNSHNLAIIGSTNAPVFSDTGSVGQQHQFEHEKQQQHQFSSDVHSNANGLGVINALPLSVLPPNAMIVENSESSPLLQTFPPSTHCQDHASDSQLLQLLNQHQLMNQMTNLQQTIQQNAMNQNMQQQLQQMQQQLQMQQMQQSMLQFRPRTAPSLHLQVAQPYPLQSTPAFRSQQATNSNQVQTSNQVGPQREYIWHNYS
jgi:hypothetical protein